MADAWLRVRAVVSRHLLVVVLVLCAFVVAGAWVTYATHVEPGTASAERTDGSWSVAGEFSHRAVVTEPNPVYETGRALPDRAVYLRAVSPRFEGRYRLAQSGDASNVDGTVTLSLVLQGVQDVSSENATVVWQTSERLGERDLSTVPAGGETTIPFSVDVRDVANRTERIRSAVEDRSSVTRVLLVARVDVAGRVGDEPVDRRETHVLRVSLREDTYRVASPEPLTSRVQDTRVVDVERSYGPLRRYGGPLLLLGGAGGLGGVLVARWRGAVPLTAVERERRRYEVDRERFDDWISTIELPPAAFDRPEARAASLGSLVDFAIDANTGVVESPNADAYYVVHDDFLYAYHPPTFDSAAAGDPAAANDPLAHEPLAHDSVATGDPEGAHAEAATDDAVAAEDVGSADDAVPTDEGFGGEEDGFPSGFAEDGAED